MCQSLQPPSAEQSEENLFFVLFYSVGFLVNNKNLLGETYLPS